MGAVALVAIVALSWFSPAGAGKWEGLTVTPENRCTPYNREHYRYNQSVEDKIIEREGKIWSPYTEETFASKQETDIEHIVSISEAHDSGLCAADRATKKRFASDLRNLTLASPRLNRYEKSGKDAAEWQPAQNQCWFAKRVIDVKTAYGLTVDAKEALALGKLLTTCAVMTTPKTVLSPSDDHLVDANKMVTRPSVLGNLRVVNARGPILQFNGPRSNNYRLLARSKRVHGHQPIKDDPWGSWQWVDDPNGKEFKRVNRKWVRNQDGSYVRGRYVRTGRRVTWTQIYGTHAGTGRAFAQAGTPLQVAEIDLPGQGPWQLVIEHQPKTGNAPATYSNMIEFGAVEALHEPVVDPKAAALAAIDAEIAHFAKQGLKGTGPISLLKRTRQSVLKQQQPFWAVITPKKARMYQRSANRPESRRMWALAAKALAAQ